MIKKNRHLIHPGEILLEEFIKPLGITQYRISKDIGVAPLRINEIIRGVRSITADTALRLGKYFKTTPQFWLNLQSYYDLEIQKSKISDKLKRDVKVFERVLQN